MTDAIRRREREPRDLTDTRTATVSFALAVVAVPVLIVIPDLGFLLGLISALLAWSLLRRGRLRPEWRRMTIATSAIGASTVLIYVMDTLMVAGFRS